jgi:hypothetical protein
MQWFPEFILASNSVCFGQFLCPSSGVHSLYTQQWYMSYRFVDSFRAGAYAFGYVTPSRLVIELRPGCPRNRDCVPSRSKKFFPNHPDTFLNPSPPQSPTRRVPTAVSGGGESKLTSYLHEMPSLWMNSAILSLPCMRTNLLYFIIHLKNYVDRPLEGSIVSLCASCRAAVGYLNRNFTKLELCTQWCKQCFISTGFDLWYTDIFFIA